MANVLNMGGGGANVESKTVKSTESTQTITPGDGVDGFNPVIVEPVSLVSSYSFLPKGETYKYTPPTPYVGVKEIIIAESWLRTMKFEDGEDSNIFTCYLGTNGGQKIRAISILGHGTAPYTILGAMWNDGVFHNIQTNKVLFIDASGTVMYDTGTLNVNFSESGNGQGVLTISANSGLMFRSSVEYKVIIISSY